MSLLRWFLLALAILTAAHPDRAAAQDVPGTVPLKLYWSAARGDNFTTATAQGERDAIAAGYQFARVEAYIFSAPRTGTVPLKLYWSAARGDNFTTATPQGERDAVAAGYVFVRIEGYIYPTPQNGTVPFKLYWSDERRDNFTTATAIGESHALAARYRLARIEGYVYPAQSAPAPLPPLPPLDRASAPPPADAAPPAPASPITPVIAIAPPPAVTAPAPPAASASGRRVALVIGNAAYTAVPKLTNPPLDAAAVAAALRRVGFQSVVVANDLTRERLVAALIAFGREAERADWGLVYYRATGSRSMAPTI